MAETVPSFRTLALLVLVCKLFSTSPQFALRRPRAADYPTVRVLDSMGPPVIGLFSSAAAGARPESLELERVLPGPEGLVAP